MKSTKKSGTQAADQETLGPDIQQMDMDAGKQAADSYAAPEAAGSALENNSCPEDDAELVEAVLQPYAVAVKGALRLRQAPRPDAPIIAELPCGAGVFADGEPGPDGWLHVLTGRLSGWMMAEYLEALPLPEMDNVAG